jgi:hypothetical protein
MLREIELWLLVGTNYIVFIDNLKIFIDDSRLKIFS